VTAWGGGEGHEASATSRPRSTPTAPSCVGRKTSGLLILGGLTGLEVGRVGSLEVGWVCLEIDRFGSLEVQWVLSCGVFFRSWLFGRRPACCVSVCSVANSYLVFFFLMK
jgi:hypothetical protein